eukprot:s829_g1.t1
MQANATQPSWDGASKNHSQHARYTACSRTQFPFAAPCNVHGSNQLEFVRLHVAGLLPSNMDTVPAGESVSQDIPMLRILLACAVILLEAAVARMLELGNADQLLISGVRCFVQLTCLGFILAPIFATNSPTLVMAYVFGFMVLVSAYEAAARPKVTYPGMFSKAIISIGISLLVSGLLLLYIVQPDPWYDAQYVIPLAGMLINNSLSGVALALNAMIDHLYNHKEQVEVLLAFGASPWEAAWPGFVRSLVVFPGMRPSQITRVLPLPLFAAPFLATSQHFCRIWPTACRNFWSVFDFFRNSRLMEAVRPMAGWRSGLRILRPCQAVLGIFLPLGSAGCHGISLCCVKIRQPAK